MTGDLQRKMTKY